MYPQNKKPKRTRQSARYKYKAPRVDAAEAEELDALIETEEVGAAGAEAAGAEAAGAEVAASSGGSGILDVLSVGLNIAEEAGVASEFAAGVVGGAAAIGGGLLYAATTGLEALYHSLHSDQTQNLDMISVNPHGTKFETPTPKRTRQSHATVSPAKHESAQNRHGFFRQQTQIVGVEDLWKYGL